MIVEAVEYMCEFALYEVILPADCQKEVVGSEVRIGLRKATRGCWPRLTKARHKVNNLRHT